MNQPRPSHVTTYVLPAAASPLALVIRRGPSKWWHFLLWDRDTGVVTPGSWFHGLIYPWRCDLSPKGDWMVILAYRATNTPPAWTALCQPPSVSAKVFWPLEHVNEGGGFFDGRLPVMWLNFSPQESEPEERARHPWEFGFPEGDQCGISGGILDRLSRDGWKTIKTRPGQQEATRWSKPSPRRNGELIAEFLGEPGALADPAAFFEPGAVRYTFLPPDKAIPPQVLDGVTWAGFNSKGDVCVVRGTQLVLLRPIPGATFTELPVMDLAGLTPRLAAPLIPNAPISTPIPNSGDAT